MNLLKNVIALILFASTITIIFTDQTIYQADAETSNTIEELNQQLVNKSRRRFLFFGPNVAELESIAVQRKALLLEELKTNPRSFLQHALPRDTRDKLPQELKNAGLIERDIELQGEARILHFDDFENKKSRTDFKIKDSKGEYSLYFTENPPEVSSGDEIWVQGMALDAEVAVNLTDQVNLQTITTTSPQTIGEIRTAVLLFNFPEDRSEPFTVGEVESTIFTAQKSVSNFYYENSFGQANIKGNVFGWFEIAETREGCNINAWKTDVRRIAAIEEIDLSNYDRFIFISTRVYSCGFSGSAGIDEVWINGIEPGTLASVQIIAHELGHTYGLSHANLLECENLAVDNYADCRTYEYYDRYDSMGGGYISATYTKQAPHFNAVNKIRLNWIQSSQILDITGPGTYRLYALEKSTNNQQVLRIPKPDTNQFYYLEYRNGDGFDVSLPDQIREGTLIHIWHQSNDNINDLPGTFLVDTTPETPFSESPTYLDESLVDGTTFNDEINNITITQNEHNADYATVTISMPEFGSSCPQSPSNNSLGKAAYFNEHTYLEIPSPNTLQGHSNQDFTIEAWIKPEEKEEYEGISYLLYRKITDSTSRPYQLILGTPPDANPANLRFSFGEIDPQHGLVQSDYTIPIGSWTHVAAVRNGEELRLYINGELANLIDNRPFLEINDSSEAANYLGGWPVSYLLEPLYTYKGAVDELRISNVARPIEENWQAGVYENPLTADGNTLALWHFEENMLDDTPNNNDGLAHGNICFTEGRVGPPPSPDFGTALKFDYQNIYGIAPAFVEVAPSDKLLMGDQFTVEAWIKPDEELINPPGNDPQNPRFILAKEGIPDEAWGYSLRIASRKLEFGVNLKKDDGTRTREIVFGQTELQPNQWYFVQAIRNGTQLGLYLNGNLEGTIEIPADVEEKEITPLTVGCAKMRDFPVCLSNFYGKIDEVRISNTARAIHQPPTNPFSADQNTLALWHFDQNVLDATTNDLDGRLYGNIAFVDSLPATNQLAPQPTAPGNAIPLNAGRNKIRIPESARYTASEALNDIKSDCNLENAPAISRLRGDWWNTFYLDYGGVDFGLKEEDRVYINVDQDCSWTF